MSQSWLKMRSKIRKIANYLTFYEMISLLAIFEPIYLTLDIISENKHLYLKKMLYDLGKMLFIAKKIKSLSFK